MTLKTPVISVVLGEGGSGGALAMAVCDELAMLENALYSVISPRGAASILWKDGTKEKEACEVLKITAEDLVNFGVCDKIIAEPTGGAHMSKEQTADNIYEYLVDAVFRLKKVDMQQLLDNRYAKFRKIGMFTE
jgi:acetyl-CoA carboxylase carboxyl transferase subunit alpha